MKDTIVRVFAAVIVVFCIVMGLCTGVNPDGLQIETMKTLGTIALVSAVCCFLVGELTGNNSQMDKLWSILPIVYAWVTVIKGGFALRLILMALLITVWGYRLTSNFAKKGAYRLRFWEGEEDYRWPILRENKAFKGHKVRWALFDLLFISLYQNLVVLLITLPMVAVMSSSVPFGGFDIAATFLVIFFIGYEATADAQQMAFQTTKWNMIKEGKKLEELPYPYSLGFNTTGLWNYSRHPNYLAEQSIWVSLYVFTLGAKVTEYGIFHWSVLGSMLLILIFMGSSVLAEKISSGKYPEYKDYQKKVNKYVPSRRYR